MSAEKLTTIPNLLSLSRLPLAVVLFACISYDAWTAALTVFLVATLTDWGDGWWARRTGRTSVLGRNLDPLTDKVLIGGAFIYLLPVPEAGLDRWMVAVVICRELFITGLRGIVEAAGVKFGADWFGKVKTVLQSITLIGLFLILTVRDTTAAVVLPVLEPAYLVLLYAMLAATVGSGVQYIVKAARVMQ